MPRMTGRFRSWQSLAAVLALVVSSASFGLAARAPAVSLLITGGTGFLGITLDAPHRERQRSLRFPGLEAVLIHCADLDDDDRHPLFFQGGGLLSQEAKGATGGTLLSVNEHGQQRLIGWRV